MISIVEVFNWDSDEFVVDERDNEVDVDFTVFATVVDADPTIVGTTVDVDSTIVGAVVNLVEINVVENVCANLPLNTLFIGDTS